MNWKLMVIAIIFIFILGNFVTNGLLLKTLMPFWEGNKSLIFCNAGSFLFAPVLFWIGDIPIPLVTGDDAIVSSALVSVVVFLTRGKILSGSLKKKILVILGLWLVFWVAYKFVGYSLIKMSGMPLEQCAENIVLGSYSIPYHIFDIVFYVGAIIAVVGLVKLVWKYKGK